MVLSVPVQNFKSWLFITSLVSLSFISIGNNNEDINAIYFEVQNQLTNNLTSTINFRHDNIKYDYKVMKRFGVELKNIVFDTMIAAWLYESNEPSFKMDSISLKYLNYLCVSFKDVVPKGKLFSDVAKIEAVAYAAEDSDITFRLYKFFIPSG